MKGLGAIIGVGLAGIFIGALAMEIVNRKNPKLIRSLQEKAKNSFEEVGDAFKKGYSGDPADD